MEPRVVEYEHHGRQVFVREDLKGRHWQHCLCATCVRYRPHSPDNCAIAQDTFENCVEHGVVTPVWECPRWEPEL